MFVGSVFVLYYGIQMIGNARATRWVSIGAVLALALIPDAFVSADQDAWVPPANGVVRIGVIVPTAGPYALLGHSFVKATWRSSSDSRRNTRIPASPRT